MPRSSHGEGGFLSGLRSQFTADPAPAPAPPPAREPAPAAVTASSTASSYLPNPSNLLVDLAPALLSSSSRILHPSTISTHRASLTSSSSSSSTAQSTAAHSLRRKLSFLRAGLTLGRPNQPLQSWSDLSTQLYLRDRVDELLSLPVPPAPFPLSAPLAARPGAQAIEAPAPAPRPDDPVPLLQGFAATIPAAQLPRAERRRRRAVRSERALGLEGAAGAGAGDSARLLGGGGTGAAAGGELTIGRRSRGRKGPAAGAAAEGGGAGKPPLETREELERDVLEVRRDMANVGVRRALVNGQVRDVEEQIAKLAKVRDELRRGLLGLREEELELEDERAFAFLFPLPPVPLSRESRAGADTGRPAARLAVEGLQARLSRLPLTTTSLPSALSSSSSAAGASRGLSVVDDANGGMAPFASTSSRRRKGPAVLPSEHDDLPPNVAFMVCLLLFHPPSSLSPLEPSSKSVD